MRTHKNKTAKILCETCLKHYKSCHVTIGNGIGCVEYNPGIESLFAERDRLRADIEKVTAERDDALSALNRLRALTTHGGWIDFVLEKTHPQVFNRIQEDGNE